jgi:hypothetical protein
VFGIPRDSYQLQPNLHELGDGVAGPSDWKAKWISWKNPEEKADWDSVRWIWVPGRDALNVAPDTVANFHLDVKIPQKTKSAAIFVIACGQFKVKINGRS